MIMVTGGNGFVGSAVARRLARDRPGQVVLAVRSGSGFTSTGVMVREHAGLDASTDWRQLLTGVQAVVHTAARVHVLHDTATDPRGEYFRINVDGTLALARQCAHAGVRRFVFLSSVKVNGEATMAGHPFTEGDAPAPEDDYGRSKLQAELGLQRIAGESGMEVVTIRPPLVYGPGVRANFRAMMLSLQRGLPLPLGAIRNQRSLVALGNLVDLITVGLSHPLAANQTFLVADGRDMSTTEMLTRLARLMDRPVRLIPVPVALLMAAASLIGKGEMARRLCQSLQVDISKARTLLGWSPPIEPDEGLRLTVEGFLHEADV